VMVEVRRLTGLGEGEFRAASKGLYSWRCLGDP